MQGERKQAEEKELVKTQSQYGPNGGPNKPYDLKLARQGGWRTIL